MALKKCRSPASVILIFLVCISFQLYSHGVRPPADQNRSESPFSIDLTEEERSWLENQGTIRIGGPLQFNPFHFYDKKGIPRGITNDYIELLFQNLEINTLYQDALPWAQSMEKMKNRDLDIIACSAKSPEREEFMLFTDPLLSFPLVIFSRDDSPFISGLEGLQNQRLAIVKGIVTKEWLEEEKISYIPVEVSTTLEAIQAVSLGRADYCIDNLASGSYLINNYGLTNTKVAAPTSFGSYNLYIAVRKDWPEMVSILNKSLAAISKKEHSEIRNQWISIRYEHGLTVFDIIKYVIIVLVLSGIIILGIILWNRTLQKEIEIRKKKEKELSEALENIRALKGLLPICSGCKKIRDDQGYWNQLEKYFSDHSDISFSHSLCPDCYKKYYGKEKWYVPPEKDPPGG